MYDCNVINIYEKFYSKGDKNVSLARESIAALYILFYERN